MLLGVSVGPGAEDFTLQPLNYRQPSDNVVMTCAAASGDGRVLLGGADGHLYELQYSVGGARKARLVNPAPSPAGYGKHLRVLQRKAASIVLRFGDPAAPTFAVKVINSIWTIMWFFQSAGHFMVGNLSTNPCLLRRHVDAYIKHILACPSRQWVICPL